MTIIVGVVVLEITMLFLPCMPGRSGEENLAPHLTQSGGGVRCCSCGLWLYPHPPHSNNKLQIYVPGVDASQYLRLPLHSHGCVPMLSADIGQVLLSS